MKKIVIGIFVIVGVGLISMKAPISMEAPLAAAVLKPDGTPPEKGKLIYEQNCLPCHQADAGGVPGMTPPLRKSPYVQGAPARLIGILLQGLNDGVEIDGEIYSNPMPPFNTV